MKFITGKRYSRDEIQSALRGEIQSYLPQYKKRIVAGCFRQELNPDAPNEIQVGKKPKVVRKAELLSQQENKEIPIFIKPKGLRDTNKVWEYQGKYEFLELLDDQRQIREAERKSGRFNELAYILRFQPLSE